MTVVPGSGPFRLSRTKEGKLKAFLKSRPEGNRANLELIKELGRALKCGVRIVSGPRSRRKTIEADISEEEWMAFVEGVDE